MKQTIILLVALVSSMQAFCQSYHPMLGDSNSWYVRVTMLNYHAPGGTTAFDYSAKYYTNGDTTVGSKSYKKFYINDPYSIYSFGPAGMVGMIREDTIARKVYFIGKDSNAEILIYNFALNSGDTMYIPMTLPPAQYKNSYSIGPLYPGKYKASVSTVSTPVGSRKYIALSTPITIVYFSRGYEDLNWVESIGSLKSPLYFYNPLNGWYYQGKGLGTLVQVTVKLICASRNGVQTFATGNCSFDSTRITAGVTPQSFAQISLNDLLLTQQYCRFQCSTVGNNNGKLEILDMNGRVVQSFDFRFRPNGMYNYNFSQPLSPGTYIINLQTGRQRFSQKMLVN